MAQSGSPLSSLWTDPEPPPRKPVSRFRRVAGWVAAAAGAVVLGAFAVGTANPWHNVALRMYLGSPFLGALLAAGLAVVAAWLAWPVRSEAAQGGRVVLRWTTIVFFAVTVIAYGLYHAAFAVAIRAVATSPGGTRTVALVTTGDERELRVWLGRGLGRHDIGGLGSPCGQVQVRFVDENTVHVSTVYKEKDLHLDPATGRPLDHLGPTCYE